MIFIDVTPDVLRERLREGKIYPPERIEAALANFFRTENLAALRELAVREVVRARRERRHAPPFARIVLGVEARERDVELIERMRAGSPTRLVDRSARRARCDGTASAPTPHGRSARSARRSASTRAMDQASGRDRAEALIDAAAAQGRDHDRDRAARARTPRWLAPASFARRLLDAGARRSCCIAQRPLGIS